MVDKIDKFLLAILLITAIVLLGKSCVDGRERNAESSSTISTIPETTETEELQFWVGQTVKIHPDTHVYYSSKKAGSGKYVILNSQNDFIINGYSFWNPQKGMIDDYKHWYPEEIEKDKVFVTPKEGLILLLHICEITEEGQLKIRGWTLASNVFVDGNE